MKDNNIYSKTFIWLGIGLLITFIIGYGVNFLAEHNEQIANLLFQKPSLLIVLLAEIIVAIILSVRITKLSPTGAKILYILYCCLSGLTFSTIFLQFKLTSIIIIFLITSVLFVLFAIIGKNLNIDLSKFGTYLLIALIGSVIMLIVNIFLRSAMLNTILSIVSILIFTLYIGYDIKKIKALQNTDINEENIAIYSAFQLYLDFINIFIRLLELFGDSKD